MSRRRSSTEHRTTSCRTPRAAGLRRDRQLRRRAQRLEDDAVALGQLQQCLQLLVARVRVEVEGEADRLEANRGLAVDGEGAAEVEVALGVDAAVCDGDPERSGNRL